MDIVTARLLRQVVPLFKALAGVLLVLAIAALLSLGRDVFIPLALGLLLSFALSPVAGALERAGFGRGASVAITVTLAIGIAAAVGWVIWEQVSSLAAEIPGYKATIQQKLKNLLAAGEGGPFSRASLAIGEILAEMNAATSPRSGAVASPTTIRFEDPSQMKLLGDALGRILHPLAILFAVVLVTAFLLGSREDMRNRVIRLVGADDLQRTTAAMDDAGRRLGKLLFAQMLVNASFGVVVSLGLWLIGMPSPFLWGILAGLLRYVPYIGAIIGMLPPLLIAFAVDPTWTSFLLTALLFLVIDLVVGHVIEPLLYGRRTGLSPLAVVVAAMIWASLWGPVGLLLATPLTICIVVLGRHIRRLEFLDVLLGDRPALKPYEMLYQRLLAGDPAEAARHARAFLRRRSISSYYDHVALDAIRRSHQDIVRGSVAGERLDTLVMSAQSMVDSLKDAPPPDGDQRSDLGAEVEAAYETAPEETGLARRKLAAADLAETWRAAKAPVAILYGAHPLDVVPARMLGQVIERFGVAVRVASMAEAEAASAADSDGVEIVLLSFIEPLSTLHLRAASLAVHRRFDRPVRVALCIWQQADQRLIDDLRRTLRVDAILTTTLGALDYLSGLAGRKPRRLAA